MGGVNKKKAGKNKGGKGGEKPKRSTPPHKEVRRALQCSLSLSACSTLRTQLLQRVSRPMSTTCLLDEHYRTIIGKYRWSQQSCHSPQHPHGY